MTSRKKAESTRNNVKRKAGKQVSYLESARFAQSVKVSLPVLTVTGARPGPLAVIMAGQHGRELNGIAAIEQVYHALDPQQLKGTVVFLPVMNPIGVLTRRQDYPTEEFRYRRMGPDMATPRQTGPDRNYNMDLSWMSKPLASTYSFAVTEAVLEAYLRHADWSMDLHGWSGSSVSLAWAFRQYRDFLRAFGMPWHRLRDPGKVDLNNGTSLSMTHTLKIPHIVAELTPQNVLDPVSVSYARRGIYNSLKYTGMLRGKIERAPVQYELRDGDRQTAITAGTEGLLVSEVPRGTWVRRGTLVARVVSLETFETTWSCKAPHDGLLFREARALWGEDVREHAIVYPNLRVAILCKVARTLKHGRPV